MGITDVFKIDEIKTERDAALKELGVVKASIAGTEKMTHVELTAAIAKLEQEKLEAQAGIRKIVAFQKQKQDEMDAQIAAANAQVAARKKEVIFLDDQMLLQSFGFYKVKYDLENSEAYRVKLEEIRAKQEAMVKSDKAVIAGKGWTVNNSQAEGEKMVKDYVKLILRSFNNECDASMVNVKFNNIDSIEKKINKAFETLNKLGQRMMISIAAAYLNLKLQELHLCYEYQVMKQKEKEEQKLLREQMREEAKVLKEIEERKLKIEKEERLYLKALATTNELLAKATTDVERAMIEQEKASIESKLQGVEQSKLDVLARERNSRAGHVYIISNVGSFGENIYKIGFTRRFDPMERVYELGDASVPFDFDIHAVIFSDDAPALELALHKAFHERRLNMVNMRREFFNVSLAEIEHVVKTNFNKPFEFTMLADASEYRQTLVLKTPKPVQ